MKHDVTKLPLWAQHEINRLSRDVAYYKKALAHGPDDSNTFSAETSVRKPLGKDTSIEFTLAVSDASRIASRITCRVDRDFNGREYLDVTGYSAIMIAPRGGNMVKVYLDPT